ncbi:dihydrodipicolinate synthase family protein [Rhodobacteraceae bacterium RKSG542]|uniref:dihydrodipicolinate synthase family protein n=1 Tax=Pseudovibrio flavus TaxID=2529854 RepID=UPI0012BC7E7D|nr:dihydrodipicolinate synthase family protein [Pseudovibrio flavus]MTI18211.1 dihydrodipicolinate synthase family protein [Pseudovibrio flavus]
MSFEPGGIYPILYAFFNEDGSLNRANFQKQIEHCLAAGAHGIAILGLVTEVGSLTPDERKQIIRWTVEAVAGHVPVATTIAGRTAEEQRALAGFAEEAGASWVIFQPPLGQKPPANELLEFFAGLMESIGIPAGIQNAPEFMGCGLEVPELTELSRLRPNFKVMKGEGPVVNVKPYVDALEGKVKVFNGRGGLELYDNLKAGCAGLVPAPDCADLQIKLYDALKAGDEIAAQEYYHRFLPYAVYSMQSIATAVFYGKQLFAERIGLEAAGPCRAYSLSNDRFYLDAGRLWALRLGPYANMN